jgi:hypothetical protein
MVLPMHNLKPWFKSQSNEQIKSGTKYFLRSTFDMWHSYTGFKIPNLTIFHTFFKTTYDPYYHKHVNFLRQTYNFVTMITNFEFELYFLVQNDIYNHLL